MSAWQVGDKALCIESGKVTREGCVYTVIEVWVPGAFRDKGRNPYSFSLLSFSETGIHWWAASNETRFRKIRPDEREACEPEFVTLLKRSKRKVTAIAAAARQSGDVQQAPSEGPQSGHEVASPKGGSHA